MLYHQVGNNQAFGVNHNYDKTAVLVAVDDGRNQAKIQLKKVQAKLLIDLLNKELSFIGVNDKNGS